MEVKPNINSDKGKKEQVKEMFDNIAFKYDFLNHFLSLGIDKSWRKKVCKIIQSTEGNKLLDIATGTGDLAIEIAKFDTKPIHITGVDISEKMLEIGKEKVAKAKLGHVITLESGDSEELKYDDHSFDFITASFGVRNFECLDKGLAEMHRVLKKGAKVVILEFGMPTSIFFKPLYILYFKAVLPFIGKLFSKSSSAYSYLPSSVEAFPYGKDFLNHLTKLGFKDAKEHRLSMGIASIYVATK
ncbi:MAG: bifunctional demethylmenaquinone methyltransferase/2-methoxy-6-polyprenyl-1,4-benzoquinol methylase UbiE [Hyphomicrobiales bacterium]